MYSHTKISAISLNSIVIMADMNVESKLESSEGEMVFGFLFRKGNSLKVVCLLCTPGYKEVSV